MSNFMTNNHPDDIISDIIKYIIDNNLNDKKIIIPALHHISPTLDIDSINNFHCINI